jgi:TPR repeat protein
VVENSPPDDAANLLEIGLSEAWALYESGQKAEAVGLLETLTEGEDPWSFYNYGLALLYEEDERAIDAFERSGDLGMFPAYATIGIALLYGHYVKEDRARSYEFLKKAADRGHIFARARLSKHFERHNIFKRILLLAQLSFEGIKIIFKNDKYDERLYYYPYYPRNGKDGYG